MGTSCEDLCTFMIVSRQILLGMRSVSDKIGRENHSTHLMCCRFLSENCAVWDNVEKYGRARHATLQKRCDLHAK
jgi:hypothetical protein